MSQRFSITIYLQLAESDASRIALGTVPGTVPGVVRKAGPEVFPAATCRSILEVRREEFCRLSRKMACGTMRAASPNATCGEKGKAVGTVTREGTVEVVCGGTSDATFGATGAMTVMGLGTRGSGDGPDGRQMGTVPRSACVGRARGTVGTSSAVQPHLGGTVPVLRKEKRQLSLPQSKVPCRARSSPC